MKRLLSFVLLCAVLLTGCGSDPEPSEPAAPAPETITQDPAAVPAEDPDIPTGTPGGEPDSTADVPEKEPEAPPEPTHSVLYIPGIEVEDAITWFNEVCLDAEYSDSGNPSLLQKWCDKIYYTVHGEPTGDDLAVLETFAQQLNTMKGFPGICEAENPGETNLNIYFCTRDEMISRMGDWTRGLDGAVTFWYNNNMIYDATICIRTDLNQHLRNSVILEELYNGLGPIQDTSLRPDSLIYAGFSEPQDLTEADTLILRLLYHPWMVCGMDADQCERVIRAIYS